jgi:carbamoyltransferase
MAARDLVVGVSGGPRHACVAVCSTQRVLAISEQERFTRVRAAGVNRSGLPDEAVDELLRRVGRRREDVASYVTPESAVQAVSDPTLAHHLAHAWTAFLPSPFESAAVLICDHQFPYVSVWDGCGDSLTPIEWPWQGPGFTELYSTCAATVFKAEGREPSFEALARLNPAARNGRVDDVIGGGIDGLILARDWRSQLEDWVAESGDRAAPVAASLQSRIGDLLVGLVAEIKRRLPERTRLCLGGSLFYNSYLNTRVKLCGEFDDVFVPINPGNAGLSVGLALSSRRCERQVVSPFLGPAYSDDEIKATLDNCKLTYQWMSDADIVGIAVRALEKGRLVAWFEGGMEWGPRTLGGRSIVANPLAPYVLDNLNRFLKQRAPWRGYALSGLAQAVGSHFSGPSTSAFMECDYTPKDPERFRHVLPGPHAAVRVHTVGAHEPPRFKALLHAFGEVTGVPMLVNTSFNGFQEPIVCSPRDAVRVFYGTGIDVLVMGHFVLAK